MGAPQFVQKALQAVAVGAILGEERLRTGVTFYPMGDGYVADPYPAYRRLREKDPVHRSRLLNGWVLTRHADISAVLRDPRFLSDERKQLGYEKMRARAVKQGVIDADESDSLSMLRADPPDHTRMRALVSRAFTPRTVEGLRGRVEAVVQEHLDAVAGQGGMDVIAALAYPLPVIIIAEMLGIPAEDHARFKHWSDEMVRGMGISSEEDGRRARRARRELRAYFEGVASARRREPHEDLLSALLAVEEAGERLSTDELYETCELLLVAGHETTTNLIGNGLLALLRNPDQWDVLKRDPSRIEHAIEELLRYDSPVQATTRIAQEDLDFDGHAFRTGQTIALVLGAANRDPAQFDDPERLDVTRDEARHLSFGHGIHFCLGSPLARLEAPIAFRHMIERFPNMRLDDTVAPQWKANIILRGLHHLPVRF
jgi:pimeloyl-[acyl-carrier protein] synthase